ncbi:MAG: ketol-acid reductoisomerase [Planctomycetota bacterium]|nr:ketol-acid reductoisomerase [Planctomycetota bacterium]
MTLRLVSGEEGTLLGPLRGRTVAVLGFGNQGAAHALNLCDAGLEVIVANRRDSANARRAKTCGFDPLPIEDAVARADLVIIALPDEVHAEVWRERIAPHLRVGTTIGFLHGFTIRYNLIAPPEQVGVIMVAPKGPGATLRRRYEQGLGIPCLFALHRDSPAGDAEAIGLAWAAGIGCARAAIVHTTFADEAETDLFGEQTVLCGGMTELILAAFETLVEAGYPPELAYMECCQEVKQVADLVYERGPAGMMEAISNTAEFGAHRAGPVLVDELARRRMKAILAAVRDGSFAHALREDHAQGNPWLNEQRSRIRTHPIEPAGEAVRAWLPWLSDSSET